MKIALVGYGKMGHMIEQAAKRAGHEVVVTIDVIADDAKVKVAAGDTDSIVRAVKSSGAEGIIEFTHPTAVIANVRALLPLGLPLVVGTTGWNDKHAEIAEYAKQVGGTVMTAGNFSIGVNMFYKIVEEAAKLMAEYKDYDVATWEMHHNQKADSPSGTALEIARIELTHTARSREGFAVGAVESLVKLDAALKSGKVTKGNLYGWDDIY